jgi:hypothetical protein
MVHSPDGATVASPGVRGSRIALAGLLFAALFVLAWYLLRGAPTFEASDDQLIAYYGDSAERTESMAVGLYVIPLAGIAFIWFMAALRDRYVRTGTTEHTILSTAHVVAGALVVVSLFTLAAVQLAVARLADGTGDFDVAGARSLLALGQASSDIMALRSAAVFVGVSASRGVRSGLFPRAFGALSMATAVVLLVGYEIAPWVSLVFPTWVAASAALILVRRRAIEIADGA